MPEQEWSMREIVAVTGTTSRTLRHYDRVDLLVPSRIGHGGLRFYDRDGLLRLQRILVLRELGMGLADIGRMLGPGDSPAVPGKAADALREHLAQIEAERGRLARIADSVRTTIRIIDEGGDLVAKSIFDGFDHTQHRDEVEERWGRQAYADSDAWYRSLAPGARTAFERELEAIVAEYARALDQRLAPEDPAVQEITARLHRWVAQGWGGREPGAEAFAGIGELYVADERFRSAFRTADGHDTAPLVRDAMAVFARGLG
ncbi:MerR family transcriptional regulator [Brachybacterium sp. DNPG3]